MPAPTTKDKELVWAVVAPMRHVITIQEYLPFNNVCARMMVQNPTTIFMLDISYDDVKYDKDTGEIVGGLPRSYIFYSELTDLEDLKLFRDELEKALRVKIDISRMWV